MKSHRNSRNRRSGCEKEVASLPRPSGWSQRETILLVLLRCSQTQKRSGHPRGIVTKWRKQRTARASRNLPGRCSRCSRAAPCSRWRSCRRCIHCCEARPTATATRSCWYPVSPPAMPRWSACRPSCVRAATTSRPGVLARTPASSSSSARRWNRSCASCTTAIVARSAWSAGAWAASTRSTRRTAPPNACAPSCRSAAR